MAWADHYVGVWAYDERGRRTQELDWRLLEPGCLFLRHRSQWRYDSPEQAEFAQDAWRTTTDLYPGGRGRTVSEPQGVLGPSRHGRPDVPEAEQPAGPGAVRRGRRRKPAPGRTVPARSARGRPGGARYRCGRRTRDAVPLAAAAPDRTVPPQRAVPARHAAGHEG
ncbi:hypothetical protein ACQ4WX_24860 [Streptomyces lasalocidi]